eukprot:Seg3463.1 transcript_id=Seg3463.1/GoldUCD/mRNA.D3Y31 product="hypothetical protein" protein_id=Seg3463.1/GoldUCD/D3Y31
MDEDEFRESLVAPSSDLLCFANGTKNLEVAFNDDAVTKPSNGAERGSCEERYRDESCSAKESTNHDNPYCYRDESSAAGESKESQESTKNHDNPLQSPCHDESKIAAIVESMKNGDKEEAKQAFDKWFKNEEGRKTSKKHKVACPEKNCSKSVVDLIRHLIQVHKWDEHDARAARGMFGLRKLRALKPGKVRKNYTAKTCPIITCGKVVLRLQNHLRQTHKLKDVRYIQMMVDAGAPVRVPHKENAESEYDTSATRLQTASAKIETETKYNEAHEDEHEENVLDDADDCHKSIVSENDEDVAHDIIPTPSQKMLFNAFKGWLMSLDGGHKKEKDAQQHVSQLLIICRYLEDTAAGGMANVLRLFDTKLLRENWLMKFQTEKRPGTVKGYLHSLLHLCDFVKMCPEILQTNEEQPIVLAVKVKYWLKTLRKSITVRKWEKREEDLENIAGQEDFEAFEKSEPVRRAIKILSEYMGASPAITNKDFTCARDYIISSLLIANAPRSGAIANMTVESVEKAVADGDTMVVTVRDHKTLQTSGPAMICIPKVIFTYLNIYLTKMRARIVNINDSGHQDKVFITHTGLHMTSSAISEQIGSFWRGAVGKHMNASLMRKSAVSLIHKRHPEFKADLALHMNHAVKTAENSYFIQDKRAKSARTAEFLNAALHAKATDREHEDENETEVCSETIFASNIQRRDISMQEVRDAAEKYPAIKGKERSIYYKVRYIISKLESPPLPTECDSPSDKIYRMNGQDRSTVEHNEKNIESSKDTKPCWQESEKADERSLELFDGEDDHVSDDPSCTTMSGKRYNYSAKENKHIANIFSSFIKSKGTVKEDAIYRMFKETESLRYLTKNLSSRQLTDKIRSMKKAHSYKNRR